MLINQSWQAIDVQAGLYERAALWKGPSRERLAALAEADEVFFRLHPTHYRTLQLVRVASQLGGTSAHAAGSGGGRCIPLTHISAVIGDAMARGELTLRTAISGGELTFVLWSLAFGTRALMDTAAARARLRVRQPVAATYAALDAMLDALGWRPYSTDHAYPRVRRRIRTELFADEWRQLGPQLARAG